MRALFTKAVSASMIASAALLVSACGGTAENTADNTTVMDANTTDAGMIDGTVSDNMTMVDGATGNDTGMAGDMMANDTMGNGM
jgi:hypothetical protein